MRPMLDRIIRLLIATGLALCLASGAVACGSACGDLANKICGCQPTRAKEEACKISIDTAKQNLDISSAEEDACQAILDSGDCTCQALQAGDQAVCGLSRDAQIAFD